MLFNEPFFEYISWSLVRISIFIIKHQIVFISIFCKVKNQVSDLSSSLVYELLLVCNLHRIYTIFSSSVIFISQIITFIFWHHIHHKSIFRSTVVYDVLQLCKPVLSMFWLFKQPTLGGIHGIFAIASHKQQRLGKSVGWEFIADSSEKMARASARPIADCNGWLKYWSYTCACSPAAWLSSLASHLWQSCWDSLVDDKDPHVLVLVEDVVFY